MYVITLNGAHCEAFRSYFHAVDFLGFNEYNEADGWGIEYVNADSI